MREYSARMEHMMYTPVTLPVTNEYGYFEIRLESIGGLGANLCGKMLGELGALYLSLNSLSFSSYGSEKRGSPVKSYIRWSPASHPLRINSPVLQPHVLGIFHEGLIGTYPVLDGISADTKIVLNTPLSCDEAAEKYNISTGCIVWTHSPSPWNPDPALTWLCSVRSPERVLLSRWIPLKHSAKILLGKNIRH